MSINKQHTGAFAKSRYGFPNFSESPKFARGSTNHELSFYIDAVVPYTDPTRYRMTDYMTAPFAPDSPPDRVGYDALNAAFYPKFVVKVHGSDDSPTADFLLILQEPDKQDRREIRYTSSIYLPGKYRMQSILGTDAWDSIIAYQRLYPISSYVARLIAVDTNQIKAVSPTDMKNGFDVLPAGISNPVNLYGAGGITSYYGWDVAVDTRLLFGRATSFYVEMSSWMLYLKEYRFQGQALPP